jgi:hypothetical protein
VLNKIDTLWDELSTPEQIQIQLERQKSSTADILGIAPEQVIAVSAQKGLVAKVNKDAALLQQSCLPQLEDALGRGIMGNRQKILAHAMSRGIAELRTETGRVIHMRKRDLTEQVMELQGLQGKNTVVIKHMRSRISQEQAEFDVGGAKIQAVRSVHLRLLKEVFRILGPKSLKAEMAQLMDALTQKGLKLGIKRAYGETFARLRSNLQKVQTLTAEIDAMLAGTFKQLNAEYGFSLQVPVKPVMDTVLRELDEVERAHLQYLGLGNAFKLAQPEFADRLVRALSARLRNVHENALAEVELWSKSAAAQLDTQLRERRRNFVRRIEAIDRISQAAGGLNDRVAELEVQSQTLDQLDSKLAELTDHLIAPAKVLSVDPVDVEIA